MKKVQGYPLPLGVTIRHNQVNFAIAVKKKKSCKLLIYKEGEKNPNTIIDMPEDLSVGEVRFVALEDLSLQQCEYNYLIDDEVVVDPYVKAITGKEIWGKKADKKLHEVRGKIIVESFEWEEDRPLKIPYHDIVAYSLHIRGYTKHKSSQIKNKGTFTGIVEKIPYLKELGINQIHCMAIYEFEECMQYVNFWGYGPSYFFAPKSSYAVNGDGINEFKNMVCKCHKAGIEVVLELPFFQGTSLQMIESCLRYYVLNYHIDGFILNPENVSLENLLQDPLLKSTKIMRKSNEFQNVMRRFLKGDEGMVRAVIHQLRSTTREGGLFNYITSHNGFTMADLVSYDAKHNELNGEQNQDGEDYNFSWNCGVEGPTRKKAVKTLRQKQMRNAFFLLIMAQGVPCILGGDEFANSQRGNNNSYCQDNEIGWIEWQKFEKERWLFDFVKGLVAFRKEHPVLHRKEELLGLDQRAHGMPDVSYHGKEAWQEPSEVSSRQLGVLYCGASVDDVDCFIAYNLHWLPHVFALPSLPNKKKWYQVIDTTRGILEEPELSKNQKEVSVLERSITLFVGR